MFNPKDQKFFDLEPTSVVPTPAWRRPRPLVAFSVLVISLAIFGAGVLLVWNLVSFSGDQSLSSTKRTAQELAAQLLERCEEGDASCENQANANAARQVGDITTCSKLTGIAYDECLSVIAFDQGDASLCSTVSDARQSICADNAWVKAANELQNYSVCANINNHESRLACEENIGSQAATANDCVAFHAPDSYCINRQLVESVLLVGDPDGCLALSVAARGQCQELIFARDDDGDGLVKAEEFQLGTSDLLSDTDADGYNDAEEVAGGYNPLAP